MVQIQGYGQKQKIDFLFNNRSSKSYFNYFFQNVGKKITRTVRISSLPNNIEAINIHFEMSGILWKVLSGPIVFPNPGPTFANEVAAADKDVTKSNSVIESKRVIPIKIRIKIKK